MKNKQLTIGLGDALSRILNVELDRRARMRSPTESIEEVKMIVEALNVHEIPLNMSCEIDPGEGVGVFETSVKTSCCRINNGGRVHTSAPIGGSRS